MDGLLVEDYTLLIAEMKSSLYLRRFSEVLAAVGAFLTSPESCRPIIDYVKDPGHSSLPLC